MEHSLYTYLSNQPVSTLENLLQEIDAGAYSEDYSYLIPMIKDILKKRNPFSED